MTQGDRYTLYASYTAAYAYALAEANLNRAPVTLATRDGWWRIFTETPDDLPDGWEVSGIVPPGAHRGID